MNILTHIKNFIITSSLAFFLVSSISFSSLALAGEKHGAENEHSENEGHQEEESHDEGHIKLSEEQIKHSGITLAKASSGTIRDSLPVYGVIAPNAERKQFVKARFEGVIQEIKKSIGDPVRKGETLAIVEANNSLKNYSITAAIDGVITDRFANIGEQITGDPLFILQDFSTVWVELSVFPKDVAQVMLEQNVQIKNSESPLIGSGNIIYIARSGVDSNQSIIARVLLDNNAGNWHPGHFVNAEITLAEFTAAIVVRNEAIQMIEDKPVVFIKSNEGFEPRNVTLGRTDGEVIEVLSGINVDEIYVSKNSFILKSEMGKEDAEHGH